MPGRRGALEEQTTKIAAFLKASEQLTKSGIAAAAIISHPVEGFIYSGASKMTNATRNLVERSNLKAEVEHEQTTTGQMLNHYSSRREKESLLMKLYDTRLPPLPLPFSEITSNLTVQNQFNRALEA